MPLIQLECFLRAAKLMSFTRAAEQMFISRQVVSAHIKALKNELGFPLFSRGGKSISLTAGGEVTFRQLCTMEQQFQSAVKTAAACSETRRQINIGVCEITEDWRSGLYEFSKLHPSCKINVDVLSLQALEAGLVSRSYNMVISLHQDLTIAATAGYEFTTLHPLQLVVAVSRQHPLAQRDSLDLSDLKEEKIYIISEDYSRRAKLSIFSHFAQAGFHPREVQEFPNYRSMELALGSGSGVCITLDKFLENYGDRLKQFPIPQVGPPIQLVIAYTQEYDPFAKELAQHLGFKVF